MTASELALDLRSNTGQLADRHAQMRLFRLQYDKCNN
eukprot:CAMPEP_0172526300 /NCGR_PEP_ID=MMETSP1067-20121228/1246_1 /TAXON_ID=265564 ORGANISM="Thalassiosira punctigera, Strain Tpunct2005C2" /NCGR_SAMPLE_ID=MMETSP1067 /ASSEMBLY_ACC=CAM_ASM_000444 /LENGTH=36 /DNA_ID= /DNA_START= /DNA_END= /DNA_ORIENTATION=